MFSILKFIAAKPRTKDKTIFQMKSEQRSKISLVSYHNEYNYGTMLQAYALWRVIHDMGFDSEYISFNQGKPNKIYGKVKTAFKLFFTDFGKFYSTLFHVTQDEFWKCKEFASIKSEFDIFYNTNIPHTSIIYDPESFDKISTLYSKFIIGSDQTWSPYRYSKKNPFFLSFVRNHKLKNSYAPSIGTSNFPDNLKPVYKQELETFENLSCRENTGCRILETIVKKKVHHVIDPTLLLNVEKWNELAVPSVVKQKYILCYLLGTKKCIWNFAEELGRQNNIPVYYIVTSQTYLKHQNRLLGIGPGQFIGLIKDAEYICTDSYHGTLFSINYRKNFYSFMKRDGDIDRIDNSRIYDVLEELSLINRFKNDGDLSFEQDIDYSVVYPIIKNLREKSTQYLKMILDS